MRFSVVFVAMLAVPSIAAARNNSARSSSAISNAGPSYAASPIGGSNIIGVGLYLGQPAGFTIKYWITPDLAIGGVVGGWLHPAQGGALTANVLYHVRDLAPGVKPFEFGLYFGGGANAYSLRAWAGHFRDDTDFQTPYPEGGRGHLTLKYGDHEHVIWVERDYAIPPFRQFRDDVPEMPDVRRRVRP